MTRTASRSDALKVLLSEYVSAWQEVGPLPGQGAHDTGVSLHPGITGRLSEIGGRIYDALPRAWGLGPFEVNSILDEWLFDTHHSGSQFNAAEVVAQLERELCQPAKSWRVELPIARSMPPWGEPQWGPGGPCLIRWKSLGGTESLTFSSAVQARTQLAAFVLAERLGLAAIGAAYALGLVRLHFDPLPRCEAGTEIVVGDQALDLSGQYADFIDRVVPTMPLDLSELEQRHFDRGDPVRAVERYVRGWHRALVSESPRADDLRTASRWLCYAANTIDFGVSMALASTVLESLLLTGRSRDRIAERLRDAAARMLGRTDDEREVVREVVRRLYQRRSDFVHTGADRELGNLRIDALELCARVVRHMIDELARAES